MSNTLTITVQSRKLSTGHKAHRSGAGKHGDRRLKRQKTRGASFRNALKE